MPIMLNLYADAIASLKSGGVILYPSDTIWGLGCDARMDASIEKLFDIKNRPENKGLYMLGPDGSIAIRLLKDELCKGLVCCYQRGIVSTSANISGAPSPTDFTSISESIKSQVDYILQPEKSDKKGGLKSSKIIKLGLGGEYTMIRS